MHISNKKNFLNHYTLENKKHFYVSIQKKKHGKWLYFVIFINYYRKHLWRLSVTHKILKQFVETIIEKRGTQQEREVMHLKQNFYYLWIILIA